VVISVIGCICCFLWVIRFMLMIFCWCCGSGCGGCMIWVSVCRMVMSSEIVVIVMLRCVRRLLILRSIFGFIMSFGVYWLCGGCC